MAITTGTRVTTKDGITGTVTTAPALTSSGYVVRVAFDAEHAHRTPTGTADYNLDNLTEAAETEAEAVPAPAGARTRKPVFRVTAYTADGRGLDLSQLSSTSLGQAIRNTYRLMESITDLERAVFHQGGSPLWEVTRRGEERNLTAG